MPVGSARQDRQRHATGIGQEMALAAKLASVGGGLSLRSPGARNARAIDACAAPVDLVALA